jgi:hypothetical protein
MDHEWQSIKINNVIVLNSIHLEFNDCVIAVNRTGCEFEQYFAGADENLFVMLLTIYTVAKNMPRLLKLSLREKDES